MLQKELTVRCVDQPYFTIIQDKQFTGLKVKPFTRKTSLQNINISLNVSVQRATDGKI